MHGHHTILFVSFFFFFKLSKHVSYSIRIGLFRFQCCHLILKHVCNKNIFLKNVKSTHGLKINEKLFTENHRSEQKKTYKNTMITIDNIKSMDSTEAEQKSAGTAKLFYIYFLERFICYRTLSELHASRIP